MIELTDTNAAAIAAQFVRGRMRAGSPAMGMVLTLIVVGGGRLFGRALEAYFGG